MKRDLVITQGVWEIIDLNLRISMLGAKGVNSH